MATIQLTTRNLSDSLKSKAFVDTSLGALEYTVTVDGKEETAKKTGANQYSVTVKPEFKKLKITCKQKEPFDWQFEAELDHSGKGKLEVKAGQGELDKPQIVSSSEKDFVTKLVVSPLRDVTKLVETKLQALGSKWMEPIKSDHHFITRVPTTFSGSLEAEKIDSMDFKDDDYLVLQLAGIKAPQLIAIYWPAALEQQAKQGSAKLTPFTVFFQPTNIPDKEGNYKHKYPINAPKMRDNDFLDKCILPFMSSSGDPLKHGDSSAHAFPYQMKRSGRSAVLVIPVNDASSTDAQYGPVLGKGGSQWLKLILQEIEKFMLRRKQIHAANSIGETALVGFSFGCIFARKFIANNSGDGDFCDKTVKQLYLLDPPHDEGLKIPAAIKPWAALGGKKIRLYAQRDALIKAMQGVSGASTFPSSKEMWAALMKAKRLDETPLTGKTGRALYDHIHNFIVSMMFTDAMRESGF